MFERVLDTSLTSLFLPENLQHFKCWQRSQKAYVVLKTYLLLRMYLHFFLTSVIFLIKTAICKPLYLNVDFGFVIVISTSTKPMDPKRSRVVTQNEETQSHVILFSRGHGTNKKRYFSIFMRPLDPKLSQVATQDERTSPTK